MQQYTPERLIELLQRNLANLFVVNRKKHNALPCLFASCSILYRFAAGVKEKIAQLTGFFPQSYTKNQKWHTACQKGLHVYEHPGTRLYRI